MSSQCLERLARNGGNDAPIVPSFSRERYLDECEGGDMSRRRTRRLSGRASRLKESGRQAMEP